MDPNIPRRKILWDPKRVCRVNLNVLVHLLSFDWTAWGASRKTTTSLLCWNKTNGAVSKFRVLHLTRATGLPFHHSTISFGNVHDISKRTMWETLRSIVHLSTWYTLGGTVYLGMAGVTRVYTTGVFGLVATNEETKLQGSSSWSGWNRHSF